MAVIALVAGAATVENEYFKITTPDDSWQLTNDDALRPYGERVDISRSDARGVTLELARIDYIEGAFDPKLYLERQVMDRKDVFCRSAQSFTGVYDSFLAGCEAQAVGFKKTSHNYTYDCEAVAFNAGFGTFMVIMAHRAGEVSLIRRLVDGMTFKIGTTPLQGTAAFVNAAQAVVKRHHLPIGNNEHLSAVEMADGDSTTVTLRVTVPYITRDNVNVPAFVMTKRDAWFKQAPEALRFNRLLATITGERKNLRYFYVDTKGNEIGTLLIVPEEYEAVNLNAPAPDAQPAPVAQAATPAQPVNAQPAAPVEAKEVAKVETREAAPAPTPSAKPATIIHVVKQGDNLTKIAKRYGVTISDIKKTNPGINVDKIKIGDRLTIPQPN